MTKAAPRILVPLAHPVAVPELARAARKLASLTGGELVLVHVVNVPMSQALATADDREAARLFDLARSSLPPDVKLRTESRVSHLVADELRKAALDLKADLILVGWREAFTLRSLVQGTLQPILEKPPCDVLIADLDVEDALARIAHLPGSSADTIGVRVLAAAAEANASSILLHDREPRTRAERVLLAQQHERVTKFVAKHAPAVDVRTILEATKRPLSAVAKSAVRAFLILVSPPPRPRPSVQPTPLARLRRPLIALATASRARPWG